MKTLATYALCGLLAVLPACQAFSPQQREAGKIAVNDAYDRGEITAAQRDDAIAALERGGFDLTTLLNSPAVQILLSALLGVPIAVGTVQRMRGPVATQQERVARAAAKQRPA